MFTPAGLSTPLTLQFIERTKDRQLDAIQDQPKHQRAIERFRENIKDVESVDDFVNDYDSFSFMMKAFDLEEKIYAKGLMKKVFESDPDDKTSLANRLQDPKITGLFEEMNFIDGGTTNLSTYKSDWRDKMVDKYIETQFMNSQRESNETVGIALKAQDRLSDVNSWYDVLADKDLGKFMRGALGMTDQNVLLDVDKQKELFETRFDIEKLKDPKEVEKLVDTYVARQDASGAGSGGGPTSPISQLISPSVGFGGGGGFTPVTINIASVQSISTNLYR